MKTAVSKPVPYIRAVDYDWTLTIVYKVFSKVYFCLFVVYFVVGAVNIITNY